MAYPNNAPNADVIVVIAANVQARARALTIIGTSKRSGGAGKTELSINDTAPSTQLARRWAESLKTAS